MYITRSPGTLRNSRMPRMGTEGLVAKSYHDTLALAYYPASFPIYPYDRPVADLIDHIIANHEHVSSNHSCRSTSTNISKWGARGLAAGSKGWE